MKKKAIKLLNYKLITGLLFVLLMSVKFPIIAQTPDCSEFHKTRWCQNEELGFKQFGQSVSGLLELKKPSKSSITFYGGMDYIITVCCEPGLYPVHFRLIDSKTKKVLYDNMNDDYINSLGFTVDKTQTIIIEFTILSENFSPSNFDENRACAGINIIWKKAPKIGF